MELKIDKELFEKAMYLKNSEKYIESAQILLDLKNTVLSSDIDYLIISKALAQVYYLDDKYSEALEYLEFITKKFPDNELYSTTLFVCFLELGDKESAFIELNRYLSNYPANRYKETLQDLLKFCEKDGLEEYKDLIMRLAQRNNIRFTN